MERRSVSKRLYRRLAAMQTRPPIYATTRFGAEAAIATKPFMNVIVMAT
jgi:hypothetical protein